MRLTTIPKLSSVAVEIFPQVHNRIIADPLNTARRVVKRLDAPKTIFLKILRTVLGMFPYGFWRVQILQPRN